PGVLGSDVHEPAEQVDALVELYQRDCVRDVCGEFLGERPIHGGEALDGSAAGYHRPVEVGGDALVTHERGIEDVGATVLTVLQGEFSLARGGPVTFTLSRDDRI